MRDLLDKFGNQEGNNIVEQFIRILRGNGFELSEFREILMSSEDFGKMLSRQTKNRGEKNGFIKNEVSARIWRMRYTGTAQGKCCGGIEAADAVMKWSQFAFATALW